MAFSSSLRISVHSLLRPADPSVSRSLGVSVLLIAVEPVLSQVSSATLGRGSGTAAGLSALRVTAPGRCASATIHSLLAVLLHGPLVELIPVLAGLGEARVARHVAGLLLAGIGLVVALRLGVFVLLAVGAGWVVLVLGLLLLALLFVLTQSQARRGETHSVISNKGYGRGQAMCGK